MTRHDDAQLLDRFHRRLSAIDAEVPSPPAWRAPTADTLSALWPLRPVLNASTFVLAAAIVALFGGLLLAGVLTEPGDESAPAIGASADATTSADPTAETTVGPEVTPPEARRGTIALPRELPAGSSRGTIDTSAGPVEWIRIPAPVFPEAANGYWLGRLVPWDDGIAAWSAVGLKATLASTTNGVDWQRVDLPAEPVDLTAEPDAGKHWSAYGDPGFSVVDGTAYLVLTESGQVWARDMDDGEWLELDATAIGEARAGEGWPDTDLRATDPVEVDGLTYFEINAGDEGRLAAAFVIDGSTVVRVDPLAGGPASANDADAFAVSLAPAGTRPENGIDWLLREAADTKRTGRWVAVGEQWVSLDGVVPRSEIDLHGARTGNVIALTGSPGYGPTELWLLVLPEGATAEPAPVEPIAETEAIDKAGAHDLLPGVDLVTEEVVPGVYRVLSDGIRDLSTQVQDVAVTPAGDVWAELGTTRDWDIVRLGEAGVSRTLGRKSPWTLDTTDGQLFVSSGGGWRLFDGERWVDHSPTPCELTIDGDSGERGVSSDDGCWFIGWGPVLYRRSAEEGVVGIDPTAVGLGPDWVFSVVAEAGDGAIWATVHSAGPGRRFDGLARFDGQTWELVPFDPSTESQAEGALGSLPLALAEGPDRTVWIVELRAQNQRDAFWVRRWDGDAWNSYGPVEASVDHAGTSTHFLDDGSIWFLDGQLTLGADGLRSLELPGGGDLVFGPDGSAWTTSNGGLYVITPEAVKASE